MKVIIRFLKDIKKRLFGVPKSLYWIQETKVKRIHDRKIILEPYIKGRKVLHIGCTDYPIFDPKNNLHLDLSTSCKELHGMDIDERGIEILSKYFPGKYFNNIKDVDKLYDTVLVPETIEHVDNIQQFLTEINNINAKIYIISGPNCFHKHFKNGFKGNSERFIESVHPDHNCWFSPYTLKNCIEKYTSLRVKEMNLSHYDMMIICICEKDV